jgi:SAM-dependent methyltransferase
MEYLDNPKFLIENIAKLVKPGGFIINDDYSTGENDTIRIDLNNFILLRPSDDMNKYANDIKLMQKEKMSNPTSYGWDVSIRQKEIENSASEVTLSKATETPLASNEAITLLIKQNFPETNNISFADLDTGTGEFVTNFTNLLKGYYQNVKGVGVELLGSLVNQARVNGYNVIHGDPESEGDYESVGLTNNSRDIVTINNIESRPWALIAQADRILKPNGLIVVTFEKYDIEEGHGIDRSVENDLRQRGYIVEKAQFPNDYPHSIKFQEADFILVAWKNKNNLTERIEKANSIDTAI